MTDFIEKHNTSDSEASQDSEEQQAVQDIAFTTYSGMLHMHLPPGYLFKVNSAV